jgi:hypothetical protein
MEPLDHLLITAVNEAQAGGFRAELRLRRQAGLLPQRTLTHVLADPHGRRVGSGGATLLALRYLLGFLPPAPSPEASFAGRRVLLLHAGGNCKRLPAYAAQGKLFTPLPIPSPTGPWPCSTCCSPAFSACHSLTPASFSSPAATCCPTSTRRDSGSTAPA